jgi:hypothetical protein
LRLFREQGRWYGYGSQSLARPRVAGVYSEGNPNSSQFFRQWQ